MIEISIKRYSVRIILITTVLAFGYAVLRYNVFGTVPWADLPIFIFNKGISLASLFLLTLNYSLSSLKNMGVRIPNKLLETRKSLGITGFAYAFAHLIMSLAILIPSYYPAFFTEGGTLSTRGGLCLFGGVVSFVFLWVYYKSFKPNLNLDNKIIVRITSKKSIMYILFFVGIHLFFLGYTGWTKFDTWPGGLPPISLISFIIFCTGFLINLIGRK
jgi:hypothetical protein